MNIERKDIVKNINSEKFPKLAEADSEINEFITNNIDGKQILELFKNANNEAISLFGNIIEKSKIYDEAVTNRKSILS